jgi:hypothetical protein
VRPFKPPGPLDFRGVDLKKRRFLGQQARKLTRASEGRVGGPASLGTAKPYGARGSSGKCR